jgi:hypothetical protein
VDREFDEVECGGEAGEVSPWYEFDDVWRGEGLRARSCGRASVGDRYRVWVPGVDYLQAWRDARAAELLLLAVCERYLKPLGLWVHTEKLVTGLGVGVVRCDIPAAGILVIAELVRDGERFRQLVS